MRWPSSSARGFKPSRTAAGISRWPTRRRSLRTSAWSPGWRSLPTHRLAATELIFFGIAVFWTYLLALLSIKPLAAKLDPKLLRTLRTIGVEYIAFVFLVTFAKNPFQGGVVNLVNLPAVHRAGHRGAGLLRFAAVAKRLSHPRTLAT